LPQPTLLIAQIDTVLEIYANHRESTQHDDFSDLGDEASSQAITLLAAAIDRVAPVGSTYRQQSDSILDLYGRHNGRVIPILAGVLQALRVDYAAGWLQSISELIHADVFSNFLDMAQHLQKEGYKDAAAVIVGSTLEGHLRKLCEKNQIEVFANDRPKKASVLNNDLSAAHAYSKLDQKNVTAWLGLRNDAAHGNYGEYTKEQVALLLQSVSDFMSRYPA
jgi:hypothetical protein